jgi:uncharacterized protein (DUF427 family)
MARAHWKGAILAESNDTVIVEGNHYFPPSSLDRQYFTESDHQTVCPWKGTASYYHVVVADDTNANAAWYYPTPKDAADNIRGYIAFWRGVEIDA